MSRHYSPDSIRSFLIFAFLLSSGCASLTYQVVWVRLLGLSMGSTSASIATVVGAFFLGLALGSYFAERISRGRVNSLRPYLMLELVIGLSGLVLLPVLLNLDGLIALLPELESTLASKFFVVMALLIVPTVCMGATFPVIAALVVRNAERVGRDLSRLYSINTAGAVLGASLSGFVLVPTWGLDGAVYTAVALNFLIVLAGWVTRSSWQFIPAETQPSEPDEPAVTPMAPSSGRWIALAALFATGFASIATEVGWTKYLSIYTGTTIYGFAAILTVFLVGIAFGSWWIRRHISDLRNLHVYLAGGLVLLGVALLLTRSGLGAVPVFFQAVNSIDAPAAVVHGAKYLSVLVLLIVPTMILGALFPLNLTLYCGDLPGIRSGVGRAYAVNTIAGIAGSIASGFWIIPYFGTDALLVVCAMIVLAIPLLYIVTTISGRTRIMLFAGALTAAAMTFVLPGIDYSRLIASVGYGYDKDVLKHKKPEVLFLKEGKAGVISLVSYNEGEVKLQNNGLNESVLRTDDPTWGLVAEQLLGWVPYFLHEQPRSAFVVGFGGGITTRALGQTSLESIRVVELEPAVVEAGRALAGGEIPALADPRVTLEFNDARNTLLLDSTRYDIIVSQPSHPWLAGAANLYTTQFFELVRSRLNEGGIYGQWVNLFNMDATTLRIIFNSFFSVFPEGMSFGSVETGDFLLFGSTHPLIYDFDRINARMASAQIKAALAHYNVFNAEDLLWYYALSKSQMTAAAAGYPVNTDTNLLTEVRLSRLTSVPEGEESPYKFLFSVYSADLRAYIPSPELPQRYFSLARRFLEWESPDVAHHIRRNLDTLNEELYARSVNYLILRYEDRLDVATRLYQQHERWPDLVHEIQTGHWAEIGEYDLAAGASARIDDATRREIATAQLLYYRGAARALAALRATHDQTRKWQLIGLGRTDVVRAGEALLKLDVDPRNDMPLLRALVRYAAAGSDAEQLDRYASLLAAARSRYTKHLIRIAENMLESGDLEHAARIIQKIERNNPDSNVLESLRKRLERARDSISSSNEPAPA